MPALGLANCLVTPKGCRFSPLSLANLAGWYDVSQPAGVTTGTGGISSLNDLSGNGRHLAQGTSTKRPALTAAGQNGLDVATFDGVDDFMSVAWVRSSPYTIALALKVRANSAGSSVIVGLGPWSGLDVELYLSTGARTLTKVGSGTVLASNIDLSDGAFASVVGVWNGASSVQAKNGTEQTGSVTARATTAIALGDSPDETSVNSAITVGELIVLAEAASADTRAQLNSYLRGKWGI
jgi:hypothetical protein